MADSREVRAPSRGISEELSGSLAGGGSLPLSGYVLGPLALRAYAATPSSVPQSMALPELGNRGASYDDDDPGKQGKMRSDACGGKAYKTLFFLPWNN